MKATFTRSAWLHPATALAALAVGIAIGGTALAAQADERGKPLATTSKAMGTKKLVMRKAGVAVPAGGFRNGNFNSATASVQCAPGEVALAVGTVFPGEPDNTELITRYSRLTVNQRGNPTGATASGATDLGRPVPFEVHVLCAG